MNSMEMSNMKVDRYLRFYFFVFAPSFRLPFPLCAQTAPTGSLRGQIADPSGAAFPEPIVIMTPATGSPIVGPEQCAGRVRIQVFAAPAKYSLTVSRRDSRSYENDNVMIADQPLRLNVTMAIAVERKRCRFPTLRQPSM